MQRSLIIPLFIFLIFSTTGFAQSTPSASPTPSSQEDGGVVKISTKLVQFDAVVTDKSGTQVRDLSAEDFVVLQDGKPQRISSLSYVNSGPREGTVVTSEGSPSSPSSTQGTRPRDGGRLITFVIDDGNCTASQIGMTASRGGLQKFVKEQMLASDRVAIFQTRSGSSMLQQYTSNKEVLLKVASRIRWYPPRIACGGSSDGSFFEAAKPNTYDKPSIEGSQTKTIESEAEKQIREAAEDQVRSSQTIGSLGVLRYVIRGLERVPGRKVVFFLSDGMAFRGRNRRSLTARDVLGDLTDLANRSSVVLNTIDVRGVIDPSMIEARDNVSTRDNANASGEIVATRTASLRDTRDGLAFLAGETGGRFLSEQNFLDVPIRRGLELETGYYLIAYEPDDDSFRGKNFNRIEVRVSRPDLKVISRAGFIGTAGEVAKPKRRTQDSELYEALIAPLPIAGLDVRLTAFYGNDSEKGNFVRSLTYLDGDRLDFAPEPNGMIKASFDVVAVTLNEKNEVVDEFSRTHTMKVDASALSVIRRNGLLYTTDVPVKKAGIYNFRLAVRDGRSRLLGSASQVIEVPELKRGRLAVSGLSLSEVDLNGKFSVPSAVNPELALSVVQSEAVPAVRRFSPGSALAYSYTIYNAKRDKVSGRPSLTVQVNLYRDGELLVSGNPAPAEINRPADWARIDDFGYLRLNNQMSAGDYALQITITDMLATGAARTSTQWIDFEITERK